MPSRLRGSCSKADRACRGEPSCPPAAEPASRTDCPAPGGSHYRRRNWPGVGIFPARSVVRNAMVAMFVAQFSLFTGAVAGLVTGLGLAVPSALAIRTAAALRVLFGGLAGALGYAIAISLESRFYRFSSHSWRLLFACRDHCRLADRHRSGAVARRRQAEYPTNSWRWAWWGLGFPYCSILGFVD